MFDLDALDMGKIHTEQIEKFARQSCFLNRCMPVRLSGSRRAKDALGNLLIDTGMRLKAQAHAQPETAPSPTFLITL